MRVDTHEITYYDTYYYSNVVHNILCDPAGYLRTMHDLFENDGALSFSIPWDKFTALHKFASLCIEGLFLEDIQGEEGKEIGGLTKLLHAFDKHGIMPIDVNAFLKDRGKSLDDADTDDEYDYFCEVCLTEDYEKLVSRMTDEIFFVMFLNREAMQRLNSWIAGYVSSIELAGLDDAYRRHFERDGKLKRVHIPAWVRQAVFHRDRGHCTRCGRDISHLTVVNSVDHFDHIVPLAQGGINDITNIQLLCGECNLRKGGRGSSTSRTYERWYPRDDT